ncbi:unnamed protein product [Malus baccata var. baccata]
MIRTVHSMTHVVKIISTKNELKLEHFHRRQWRRQEGWYRGEFVCFEKLEDEQKKRGCSVEEHHTRREDRCECVDWGEREGKHDDAADTIVVAETCQELEFFFVDFIRVGQS